MNLIAAAALDWGIGYKGDLLAKIPEDMKYFRQKTIGNVVVMGRKTLESFPGGKPLPDRLNIVLSASQKGENAENLIWVKDLDELFETLEAYDTENVFIIGGGMVYNLMVPYCHKAYITRINKIFPADAYIFDFDSAEDWTLAEKGETRIYEDTEFSFDVYERVK